MATSTVAKSLGPVGAEKGRRLLSVEGAGQCPPLPGTACLPEMVKDLLYNFPTNGTAVSLSRPAPRCPLGCHSLAINEDIRPSKGPLAPTTLSTWTFLNKNHYPSLSTYVRLLTGACCFLV